MPARRTAVTQIGVAIATKAVLGECPRWHDTDKRLYWVDIGRHELHRLDPATGRNEHRAFAEPVGCFAFMGDGCGLVLGMKDGLARLDHWDGDPAPFGDQVLAGRPDLRLNDGRVDSRGRFWVGSVNMAKSAKDAALYRFDADGRAIEIQGGMATCNGAAFSADGQRFCHTDTPSHILRTFGVDPDAGTLSDERVLHRFAEGHGRPDGGSFDRDGYYWTALYDGGRVVRLSPAGEVVETVCLPVPRPTMIAFGGDDGRTAYVTTARQGMDGAALDAAPLSGAVFAFRVAVAGVPEHRFGRPS